MGTGRNLTVALPLDVARPQPDLEELISRLNLELVVLALHLGEADSSCSAEPLTHPASGRWTGAPERFRELFGVQGESGEKP